MTRLRKPGPLLQKSWNDPVDAAGLLKDARRDAEEYLRIAESRPSWATADSLVEEMRRVVTTLAAQYEDEDMMQPMSAPDRANLEQALRQIADEYETRIRNAMMSMFDRIGAPEEMSDPRPLDAKSAGAHHVYR